MPFLTYDPLPQCLQPSPLTPLLLARGHQRGSRRYLLEVKCLPSGSPVKSPKARALRKNPRAGRPGRALLTASAASSGGPAAAGSAVGCFKASGGGGAAPLPLCGARAGRGGGGRGGGGGGAGAGRRVPCR